MKNMSVWALVLIFALVGSAIWYEIQYRQKSPEAYSPVRRASVKKNQPKKIEKHDIKPTNENGQFVG